MRIPNAGQAGKLPEKIKHENQLRDAPISLKQLEEIVAHIEKDLSKDTPQEKQYLQLHIRQVRGILNEVASIEMKLNAALEAVKAAQGKK